MMLCVGFLAGVGLEGKMALYCVLVEDTMPHSWPVPWFKDIIESGDTWLRVLSVQEVKKEVKK